MNKYLRYAVTIFAVVTASMIALVSTSGDAEARSRHRYKKHYSHGYHHVYKYRHHSARRAHVRKRLVINVRSQSTAQAASRPAEVNSESALSFAIAQYNLSGGSGNRGYTLRNDGTFGDLVQGTYGGQLDLIRAAERYLYTNPTGMRRNWCRAFLNMVARQQGYRINPSLMARAPTGGRRVSRPVPGAVAQNRAHTGFVKAVSADGRKILLISGNSGGRGPGRRTTTEKWRPTGSFQYAVLSK